MIDYTYLLMCAHRVWADKIKVGDYETHLGNQWKEDMQQVLRNHYKHKEIADYIFENT